MTSIIQSLRFWLPGFMLALVLAGCGSEPKPPTQPNNSTFTIGGSVSNLKGTLQLALNGDSSITLDAATAVFSFFDDPLKDGEAYTVTLEEQPNHQVCEFLNGSNQGRVDGKNVTSIRIECQSTFSVEVRISGLVGSLQITLAYNGQTEAITPNTNGTFSFPTRLLAGTNFSIALTNPAGQLCSADTSDGEVGNADVLVTITCGADPGPAASPLSLVLDNIKTFHFSWPLVAGGSHYKLYEDPDGEDGPAGFQLIANRPASQATGNTLHVRRVVPLYARAKATYLLSSCNSIDQCNDGQPLPIAGNSDLDHLIGGIGYFKTNGHTGEQHLGASVALSNDGKVMVVGAPSNSDAAEASGAVYIYRHTDLMDWKKDPQISVKASNIGYEDYFGEVVSLNGNGNYLAVGVRFEDGSGTGVNSKDDPKNPKINSGAVYIFHYQGEIATWVQQAYIKAFNAEADDQFGTAISLNDRGDVLAIGAPNEDSNATGVSGDQNFEAGQDSGAVYLYQRTGEAWNFDSYIKATNIGSGDKFGSAVSLSGDGRRLAIGAPFEDGKDVSDSGAVYLYQYSTENGWNNEATYFKADHAGADDQFGQSVSLSQDGKVLAVGAPNEDSSAIYVHPTSTSDDNSSEDSGAVYLFLESDVEEGEDRWRQAAYIKASNTGAGDSFGQNISLSDDGERIAVSAQRPQLDSLVSASGEDSRSAGINGVDNDEAKDSGAVYTYVFQNDQWQFESYVKASNTRGGEENVIGSSPSFGFSLSLSGDGQTLAVGASNESNKKTGITRGETEDSKTAEGSGAVYLY